MLKRILLTFALLSAGVVNGQAVSEGATTSVVSSSTTTWPISEFATTSIATDTIDLVLQNNFAPVASSASGTQLLVQDREDTAPKLFELVYGGFSEFVERVFGW